MRFTIIFLFIMLFSVGIIYAEDLQVGFDDQGQARVDIIQPDPPANLSGLNVSSANSSEIWITIQGLMDNVNDTYPSLNLSYLAIGGENADRTIDIGSEYFVTSGKINASSLDVVDGTDATITIRSTGANTDSFLRFIEGSGVAGIQLKYDGITNRLEFWDGETTLRMHLTRTGVLTLGEPATIIFEADGDLTTTGTVQAEHFYSTDDAQIDDDLTVLGDTSTKTLEVSTTGAAASFNMITATDHAVIKRYFSNGVLKVMESYYAPQNCFKISHAELGVTTATNQLILCEGEIGIGKIPTTALDIIGTITTDSHQTSAEWELAYDHISTTGGSHTWLNQPLLTTSSPIFAGATIDGVIVGLVGDGEVGVLGKPDLMVLSTTGVTLDGNLNITGNFTGNQIYGEFYNYSSVLTPANQEINLAGVYYNWTGNASVGNLNGFTFSANSKAKGGNMLTAQVRGEYKFSFAMSFLSETAGGLFGFSIAENSDQMAHRNCYSRREAKTEVGSVSVTCIMDLMVGSNLSIMIENENADRDINIHTANLNVVRVGN